MKKRILFLILIPLSSCINRKENMDQSYNILTVTSSAYGHTIHHNNVFSKDDMWIVFDGRNDETKIGETSIIGVVNVNTGEEQIIYQTKGQTVYGPGVGAASFSPVRDQVIFIHGLPDANEEYPYAMSRRTGMLVDIHNSGHAFPADARDVSAPYIPGSLRGGTHSHCWSPDGTMLSFTYNDEWVEPDLRVVGVMLKPDQEIVVDERPGNSNGQYYSAIVSDVVASPTPGSDEINKAFDECWLAPVADGITDNYSIAFQGNTINAKGEPVTEIFLVEIDSEKILADKEAVGEEGERPRVPKGIQQKRLTSSERGLSDLRHWLRSSADGQYIYALAKDDDGKNQIVSCDRASGKLEYVSNFDFSIASPINISHKGDKITFVADNNVFIFEIGSKKLNQLTDFGTNTLKIAGAPLFSRKDDKIAFNQFVELNGHINVQIKLIEL